MTEWKRFEIDCERLLRATYPNRRWKISKQVRRVYDGGERRLDLHVHERTKRGGGFRWVFECKHKPKTGLTRTDVRQAYDYKRAGRASAVTLLISSSTPVSESVDRFARDLNVHVLSLKWETGRLIQILRDVANKELLKWHTQAFMSDEDE